MKRLLVFLASFIAAAGIAATASANVCACGNGGYPILIGSSYGICTYDSGPYASTRYWSRPC
jgi:hypothetical protein